MKDMDVAVDRLNDAMGRKERILVYGDYDVDGCTAVALVYKFLQQFYSNIDYYIPDRYDEGYGVSQKGIDYAKSTGVKLIIIKICDQTVQNIIQLFLQCICRGFLIENPLKICQNIRMQVGSLQNILQYRRALPETVVLQNAVNHPAHKRLWDAAIDSVHAHMVGIICAPAQRKLTQITGPRHKTADFSGVVH